MQSIPEIITGIFNALVEGVSDMIEAGWQLLQGLWEGISQAATWLWDKIHGWLEGLWGDIKEFFGIASPSKEMAWIGDMLVEGLAKGIDDNAKTAIAAAEDMAAGIVGAVESVDGTTVGINAAVNGLDGTSAAAGSDVAGAGDYTTNNNDIVINVYGAEGQNVNVLADEVIDRLQRTIIRSEAVYA